MSIAAAVLDFYDDAKHELMAKIAMPRSLANTHMTMLTPEQHEALPDNEFGLVILTKRAAVLRKYPVNDPGNAWMSAQYFQNTHDKLAFPARHVAAKFIKSACDAYGIPSSKLVVAYAARADEDITRNTFVEGSESQWMLHKLAQRELLTKEASAAQINARMELPDEHFALVINNGDGSIIRRYAMPDERHVKMAAAYFDKYAMDLSPEHRHRFATAVIARAEDLGVDVTESNLQKWASTEWNPYVHAHLEQRKSLLPQNESARRILDKLAASLTETTPEDAATALQTFDQATGLAKYYDRGLTDPFASTMAKTSSPGWADEYEEEGRKVRGRPVSAPVKHTLTETDLRSVAGSSKLAGYLGESFANQFKQNPVEVYESLPDPEKVLIRQIAAGEA